MADNYWSTGARGPAGPCSEIYIDRGPEYGQPGGPIVDEDRYLEIWNLVFMEFERDDGGDHDDFPILGELQQKNIDTGMGLERVALLKQGVDNMYEIDEVYAVIAATEELTGKKYGTDSDDDVRMRVIADHVRSAMMMILDGITPGNEGRGYVLRRLLRRAIRAVRLLGVTQPALPVLLPASQQAMVESYPELETEFDRISSVAYAEESSFRSTLDSGTTLLSAAVEHAKEQGLTSLSGHDAFTLHDTHGFPIDLTLEIAAEAGLSVDESTFRELMTEQRERARADAMAKRSGHVDTRIYQELLGDLQPPTFVGYDNVSVDTRIAGVLTQGQAVPTASAAAEVEIILYDASFYAEAGGQLADEGTIRLSGGGIIEVDDVQSPIKGLPVHRGRLIEGQVTVDEPAHAAIAVERRVAISKAHSATHMVHKAVREALGDTATQAGSENAPSRMRFDFRSGAGLEPSALQEVEERVNLRLMEDLDVTDEVMTLQQAQDAGAMALFGEKYGDEVRVVSIGGEWSKELCGGTHVQRSGEIGRVTLLGESSIGSGIRRIDALVGHGAYEFHAREHAMVGQLSSMLNAPREELPHRIENLVTRLRQAEKELTQLRQDQLLTKAPTFAEEASKAGAITLVVRDVGEVGSADDLRTLTLEVRQRLGESAAVLALLGVAQGRPLIVVAVNPQAQDHGIAAGSLVRMAAQTLGGGGGGKADIAQGGGSDPQAISDAVNKLTDELKQHG